jgi:hypothetical protein
VPAEIWYIGSAIREQDDFERHENEREGRRSFGGSATEKTAHVVSNEPASETAEWTCCGRRARPTEPLTSVGARVLEFARACLGVGQALVLAARQHKLDILAEADA